MSDIEHLLTRLEVVEEKLERLYEHLGLLEETDVKRNETGEYMIKVFYPGVYFMFDNLVAAFPKNRRRLASMIQPGSFMFLYVTSPEKKIIGLAEVTGYAQKQDDPRWPYCVPLKMVLGPKSVGVTFRDLGLEIRPRIGDTLFAVSEEKAQEIINFLKNQPDLDDESLEMLKKRYASYYKKDE